MTTHLNSPLSGKTVLLSGSDPELLAELALSLSARATLNFAIHHIGPNALVLEEAALQVESQGCGVVIIKGRWIGRVFNCALREFGRIDSAINIIGKAYPDGCLHGTTEQVCDDAQLLKDARTAYTFIRDAGRSMQSPSNILTLQFSTMAGNDIALGEAGSPVAYFTRTASTELQNRGVSVTAICMKNGFQRTARPNIPDMPDLLNLIYFLCAEGRWITGLTIQPDDNDTRQIFSGPIA